jgi:phosphoribosylaminoimidazole (AIR) synthetase
MRTYLDVVPEVIKERLSKSWGERKRETFAAAEKTGLRIEQGSSFNKVVTFVLEPGYYHLVSNLISVKNIAGYNNLRSKVSEAIDGMVRAEKEAQCVPLVASNVCDWDSKYAQTVGANINLRDAVINACIANNIVLTGGETANLGDQLRQTGMSWMFTILSRYDGQSEPTRDPSCSSVMDRALHRTFQHVADNEKFEIVYASGIPLLHVKERSKFMITADGTGSKSIVCELVDSRTDIEDTLAMAGDDSPRDGAFPVIASIGVHAWNSEGRFQTLKNMARAGEKHRIPLVGSVFHRSKHVYTYTMNGVMLSEFREGNAIGGKILPGLELVLLYEEQRSNGITLQRRILEETFGPEWYKVPVAEAVKQLNRMLRKRYTLPVRGERTLGQLVSQPSTPYFRVDSLMPGKLLETIKLRVNVSSGGMIGKTRRAFEQAGLGADYFDLFDAPELILILQMASRVAGSKGLIPDQVAYYAWGCGNGSIIGTTCPNGVVDYYRGMGVSAKVGGVVTSVPEIKIRSRALDSIASGKPHILTHKYADAPLG